MEHLIVALHSHAFLCLALMLIFGWSCAAARLAPHDGFVRDAFNWLERR